MRSSFPPALAIFVLGSLLGTGPQVEAQTRWSPSIPRPLPRIRPLAPIQTEPIKDATDVLFEKMAPWVFVEFRRTKSQVWGRFLNTTTGRKSDWLFPGQTLEGAKIAFLNSDRARLVYGKARQDLLFVPEKVPKFDPTRKRTPEEIVEAQRRYSEFYMKKFILSGKEYARQRGSPSAPQHQWYPKP